MASLVLASCSPRRSELLHRLGLSFRTDAPDVDEHCSLPAAETVCELSRRKALACVGRNPGSYILGSDTLVALEDQVLGKPADPEDAVRMLQLLSGRTHQVYTGVTVISPDGSIMTDYDRTDVTFSSVPEEEILSYVRSGEPLDKAGAYALQGRAGMWIAGVSGSESSVIGLPLYLVRSLLIRSGFPLLQEIDLNQ